MGKIRGVLMYTGTESFRAEKLYGDLWYVWRAHIIVSEKLLMDELCKMDKWEIVVEDK